MKNNLLTALSLIACFTAFSQEEVNPVLRNTGKTEQSPTPSTVQRETIPTKVVSKSNGTTISKRAGEQQRVHDQSYYQEEIAKIDVIEKPVVTKFGFDLDEFTIQEDTVRYGDSFGELMTSHKVDYPKISKISQEYK